jgi:caffeoyl-CoA O-methyltransferase
MTDDNRAQLEQFVTDLFAPEDEVLKWIREESDRNGLPTIHVQPADGRLLQILMLATNARRVVEIGTLGGYSGVWMARALPPDGKLYTLEKSSKHAQVARASFARAGLSNKVELREGAALDWLDKLRDQGPFDFVFIDADKGGYQAYLDWAVDNLRLGGIVTAHNAFRGGQILDPESDDDRSIKAFDEALASNPRLDSTILAIGDGMALGIKKA